MKENKGIILKNCKYLIDEKFLTRKFSVYGKIERIGFTKDNRIVFINFTQCGSAYKAVTDLRKDNNQYIDFNNNTSTGKGKGASTGKGKGASTGKGKGASTGKGKGASTGKGKGASTGKGKGASTGKGKGASTGRYSVNNTSNHKDNRFNGKGGFNNRTRCNVVI